MGQKVVQHIISLARIKAEQRGRIGFGRPPPLQQCTGIGRSAVCLPSDRAAVEYRVVVCDLVVKKYES